MEVLRRHSIFERFFQNLLVDCVPFLFRFSGNSDGSGDLGLVFEVGMM